MFEIVKGQNVITVQKKNEYWKEWAKTIGQVTSLGDGEFSIAYEGKSYAIRTISTQEGGEQFTFPNIENSKSDIKFLNNILYALDMVYIKCNNASYIIPYPENPEALNADAGKYKIETGKCYRVDKFIKIMNSMFDESSVKNSDSNTVGSIALPYRKSYTLLYVIAAGILIGIIVLIAVFRHRFFHITQ